MGDIKKYCSVVVLVDQGQAVVYPEVDAGIAAYRNLVAPQPAVAPPAPARLTA